jgi:exodeoxyribonuclease III
MQTSKLATYNINGIRAAQTKGLFDFINQNQYDMAFFQETKATPDQVKMGDLKSAEFHDHWHSAEKKGYSGVMSISKKAPDQVIIGMGNSKYDSEGRVIRMDFGDLTILNCYFPSGSSGEDRHDFKMEFLADFFAWAERLKNERENLIVVGDYNIVHKEMDIHNPGRKDNPSGYRLEEREWMDDWFKKLEFTDAFRHLHPDEVEFSWWSYRAGSRRKNLGWRIDYISVSEHLQDRIIESRHRPDAMHSDHCPVEVTIRTDGLF